MRPFDFLYKDTLSIKRPNGINGLGEKAYLPPFTIRGKILEKEFTRTSKTGEQEDFQGKLRFNHNIYKLQRGDTFEYEGNPYYIADIPTVAGGIYSIEKEKVAMLRWLV